MILWLSLAASAAQSKGYITISLNINWSTLSVTEKFQKEPLFS
jgi:hypothetical protein